MTALLDPAVLLALLIALAAGFALGRFTARGRSDPSDVSRLRRQTQAQTPTQTGRHVPRAPSLASTLASAAPSPDLPPEAIGHLQSGRLINAIKVMKDANPGMGLKQAKDAVENYQRRHGLT